MLTLFRVGYYLVAGELLGESRGVSRVRLSGRVTQEKTLAPLMPGIVEVRSNLVVRRDLATPPVQAQESDVLESFDSLLHASIMPHVASLREIQFRRNALVAYEYGTRGLGFLQESKVHWVTPNAALRHKGLGTLLALEALRPRLLSYGLLPEGYTGRADRSFLDLDRNIHVFMKTGPFRDVTQIYKGTRVEVRGYESGCALLEADGEPFWRPLEDPYYVLPDKDDEFYFALDGDHDQIPDPLSMLPSKLAVGTYPGSARYSDNWNPTPDMPKVAGNFYSVAALANPDYYRILGEGEDPVETALSGNLDELLIRLAKPTVQK